MGIYCLARRASGIAALAFAAGLGLSASASAGQRGDPGKDGEIRCLALTIYYEARGEPLIGKLAVGHVVMNRAQSGAFPDDVCDVVREGGARRNQCQFSWYCDGLSDRPRDVAALRESLRIAQKIYDGCTLDPSDGALFFHATNVRPGWRKWAGRGERIGGHVFYRGKAPAQLELVSASTRDDRPGIGSLHSCVERPTPPEIAEIATRRVVAPNATRTAARAVAAPKETESATRAAEPSADAKTATRPVAPREAESAARPAEPSAEVRTVTRRVAPRGGQVTALPSALSAASASP